MLMTRRCYQRGPGDRRRHRRSRLAWRWRRSERNFMHAALPPANFKSTENERGRRGVLFWRQEWRDAEREEEVGGEFLWGTQQGHLPGAIWWWRRFYTVVFVCLFSLGFLPESAAGRPSVIIDLSPSPPVLLPSLSPSLCVFLPLCFRCYHRKSAGGCHCDWWPALTRGGDEHSWFLLITPQLNQWFDSRTFSLRRLFVLSLCVLTCPCTWLMLESLSVCVLGFYFSK